MENQYNKTKTLAKKVSRQMNDISIFNDVVFDIKSNNMHGKKHQQMNRRQTNHTFTRRVRIQITKIYFK